MLMLYVAMDTYLREGGKLGFVTTQTVFKTKGAEQRIGYALTYGFVVECARATAR